MDPVTEHPADSERRPTSLQPRELGFTPQSPVPWMAPLLLAATGARVFLAEQFGAYLDKRELQSAFPAEVHDHSQGEEFWFDYVADVGDGFNGTYSVAYLLGQRELDLGGTRVPRGQALIFGGDQVYPTASSRGYDDRFKGPYQAALPSVPPGEPEPVLYALPGNHDWYDGLTAFLRVFTRGKSAEIGAWRTAQTRSYFALKLPHRWWLFAIDAQEGAYIDDPQLAYFRKVCAEIKPGDRVILCTPHPAWVQAAEKPSSYETTDYFIRRVVAPTGAEVALMLSGDLHHYSRYAAPGRQLITFGGGGAYLRGTDQLPKKITVPPKGTIIRSASQPQELQLAKTYPSRMRSRALGTGIFLRLLTHNPSFLSLLGAVQTLLLLALSSAGDEILTMPVFAMLAVTFGLTMFFSVGFTVGPAQTKHYVLGLLHGAVQVGIGALGLAAWRALVFDQLDWPLPVLAAVFFYGPVAAIVSAEVVALYLLVASRFDVNQNELFAAQGIEDYKGFLRLHVTPDGSLTIYPIGLDDAGTRWRANPSAPPHAPWIEPKRRLRPRLIEPPITVPVVPSIPRPSPAPEAPSIPLQPSADS